jgi:hypothetical protein
MMLFPKLEGLLELIPAIHAVRCKVERERDGYKAQAELRGEALTEDARTQHHHGPTCNWGKLPKPQLCVCCSLEAAIDATPEEAREKEEQR